MGGGRLFDYDVDDIFPIKAAGVAQEILFAVVVVFGPVFEIPIETAKRISGNLGFDGLASKGPGCVFYVILGVVADSHGEELKQFAAPILIDGAVVVAVVVQPPNHGRVLSQFHQQVAEAAQGLPTEHGDLLSDLRRVVHLRVSGGEKLVPEEGQLLF